MDKEKGLDMALQQIERQFGKGAVMRLGDHAARLQVEAIPTGSLALDIALGIGGFPRGRVVELFGPESSGKTTVALHVVAEAQKAGGVAAFIDAEHALDPAYAKNIGVDIDSLLVSQPDTGEQALEITDMLIRSNAIDIVVIDSVAALVPRAEIEGEMGDTHVGLQARLMSQAMRKLTGSVSKSRTCVVFINQIREKVGVLFGCFNYQTKVTLADGSQKEIGKIVNQRLSVDVLTYNFETGVVEARPVTNWFRNGRTDQFLQVSALRPGRNGKAQFSPTPNHLVRTPNGWVEAEKLRPGHTVLIAEERRLSDFQWEVIRGGLMGDGALSRAKRRAGATLAARYRMGHGAAQADYLDWKVSLLANIPVSRTVNEKGAVFADFTPLAELADARDAVYTDAGKEFSWDYLKRLTPLSLAIWYMDDGHLDIRDAAATSSRIQICVQAMSTGSRGRLVTYLRDTWDLDVALRYLREKAVIVFPKIASEEFQELIASCIHPSMEYKLLPRYRGQFTVEPSFTDLMYELAPSPVLDVHKKPLTRSMERFDIEVKGSHNYFVDGVMVHNSPEVTPGGRALKFYSSVRLDVRRVDSIKDGAEVVGNRVKAKVVKNKCSPPFKTCEFDLQFGRGISREGSLLDVAVEAGVVKKSGAWFTFDSEQIGQGRENAKSFLVEHPDVAAKIERLVKFHLLGSNVDAEGGSLNGEVLDEEEPAEV
jgi:recombination protein RecA